MLFVGTRLSDARACMSLVVQFLFLFRRSLRHDQRTELRSHLLQEAKQNEDETCPHYHQHHHQRRRRRKRLTSRRPAAAKLAPACGQHLETEEDEI